MASEYDSELAQQGCPFLEFRYPQRHPSSMTTPDAPELKAQKFKALTLLQIHISALFLIHLDLEFCQFLLCVANSQLGQNPPSFSLVTMRHARSHYSLRPSHHHGFPA